MWSNGNSFNSGGGGSSTNQGASCEGSVACETWWFRALSGHL
jgi:hypothetical protein